MRGCLGWAGLAVLGVFGMPLVSSAQVFVVGTGPEVSEIGGAAEAEEGDGLAFGVGVINPTGEALDFEWDLGDGSPTVAGRGRQAVTHRYRETGDFTVNVRVTGSEGFSATRRLDIAIRNATPTIHGLSHDEPVVPNETFAFQADATDPGDEELIYVWDFGDGTPPRSGVELREPTHRYAEAGVYQVTLTVRDDDGLEDVRTIRVFANPGFLGTIAGDVGPFRFAGESGKASLLNALPGTRAMPLSNVGPPLFTGSAPIGGGVADLSDAYGVCMVNAGFWDDQSRAHINFVWTPDSDSIFVPRLYPVGWEEPTGDHIPPDQLMVNALILEIEPSYEDTKSGAENLQVFDLGTGIRGIRDLIGAALGGRLGGLFGGGGSQQPEIGPGRNYQLTSVGGYMRTTKLTDERIHGVMDVVLRGAWISREGPGEATVEVAGEFAWEMDAVARANLARCGAPPFGIESHTPGIEELNTSFESPSISLTFTQQVQGETVNPGTIQVGYMRDGSGFELVEGTLLLEADGRTVLFTPEERLLDAVYYHVRVTGGNGGVRSIADETLVEDYEWRFATVLDLLEPDRNE